MSLWGRLRDALVGGGAAPESSTRRASKGRDDHWVGVSLDDLMRDHPNHPVHVISLAEYRASIGDELAKFGIGFWQTTQTRGNRTGISPGVASIR